MIRPESEELIPEMLKRARDLGFSKIGIVGFDGGDFRVEIIGDEDFKREARRARSRADILAVRVSSLEGARRSTFSAMTDCVIASYSSIKPNFDYVSALQLKRNEGAIIFPIRDIMISLAEDPRPLRGLRLELRVALRAGVRPWLVSFASTPREVVPPRLIISAGQVILGMTREQAILSMKEVPSYMMDPVRKAKFKGAYG